MNKLLVILISVALGVGLYFLLHVSAVFQLVSGPMTWIDSGIKTVTGFVTQNSWVPSLATGLGGVSLTALLKNRQMDTVKADAQSNQVQADNTVSSLLSQNSEQNEQIKGLKAKAQNAEFLQAQVKAQNDELTVLKAERNQLIAQKNEVESLLKVLKTPVQLAEPRIQ